MSERLLSKILLWLFPFFSWAGFSEIANSDRYLNQRPLNAQSSPQGTAKKNIHRNLRRLMEQERQILKLLARQQSTIIVRKSVPRIIALSRFKGLLLNSVIATNVKPSKFIVRILEGDLTGGELRCQGHGFEKRVLSHCDLMALGERTWAVDVDLWGLDGAEGIIGDYYYSGEEKAFLSSSFAAFLQGVIEAGKQRITTPFGEIARDNAKNKIMQGLSQIAGNARGKIAESAQKPLAISYINAGKKVLVFFNQTLNMEEKK